jgi:hypothetical protein
MLNIIIGDDQSQFTGLVVSASDDENCRNHRPDFPRQSAVSCRPKQRFDVVCVENFRGQHQSHSTWNGEVEENPKNLKR